MKVQKGWEDESHTIPHYEFIDKINIMWMDNSNIFSFHKNISLIRNGNFWNVKFKKRGFVIDPNIVYWFNDLPIIILLNLEDR